MKWVRRSFVFVVGGAFAFFFIAFVTSQYHYFGCDLCPLPERYDTSVESSVRLLDCTSLALNNGPVLAPAVLSEFGRLVEERDPSVSGRLIVGELQYSPRGELQNISLETRSSLRSDADVSPTFSVSPDREVFYPLKSRRPGAVCTSPTRVTFFCFSTASSCSVGAYPA